MGKRALVALLCVLFATSVFAHPHQWCWDAYTPAQLAQWNVLGYRVRWTVVPGPNMCWHPADMQDIDITTSCEVYPDLEDIGTKCCDGGLAGFGVDQPAPGNLIFFVITAYNVVGESVTDHGPIDNLCP